MNSILIIDNHDSFFFNIIGLLKDIANVNIHIMKNDEINFSIINSFNKVILSPGPGSPKESEGMTKLIQKTYKTHSILGVCLGHQAIVEFFGGNLKQLEFPKHGHKSSLNIIDNEDLIFQNINNNPIVGRYHSLVAENIGKELKVSSVDEDNNIMSVFHPNYKIHGVQFHPESIISNCGESIIYNWLNI